MTLFCIFKGENCNYNSRRNLWLLHQQETQHQSLDAWWFNEVYSGSNICWAVRQALMSASMFNALPWEKSVIILIYSLIFLILSIRSGLGEDTWLHLCYPQIGIIQLAWLCLLGKGTWVPMAILRTVCLRLTLWY